MSDDEIMVAIAEKVGWIKLDHPKRLNVGWEGWANCFWQSPQQQGSSLAERKPPNYPNDLNAIREAVLSQSEAFQDQFDEALKNSGKWIASMTAREWCDIFVGLWKDNPTPERSENRE